MNKLDSILLESPINIYKMVLDSRLSKFPNGFWSELSKPNDYNIIKCTKYLIENILHWNDEMIKEKFSAPILKKYKLSTPLTMFKGSPYTLINFVYPGKFKPWELVVIPIANNNKEIAREATRWLIEEKLKLKVPDDLKCLRQNDFQKYNISFVLNNYHTLYDAIKDVYPFVEKFDLFKLSRGEYSEENAIKAFRWYIEDYLCIKDVSKLYKLKLSDFNHEKIKPSLRYFKDNYRKAIILLYGDTIKPWLFLTGAPDNYFSEKMNRLKAIEWLAYDLLKFAKPCVYLLSNKDIKYNKLDRMFHDYYSNNLSALYIDLYGKTRERLIKDSPILVTAKVITDGEVKQGTCFNLKRDIFCYIPNGQIKIICNNKEYFLNIANSRITKAKIIYQNLHIKSGDILNFRYIKIEKTMYIY